MINSKNRFIILIGLTFTVSQLIGQEVDINTATKVAINHYKKIAPIELTFLKEKFKDSYISKSIKSPFDTVVASIYKYNYKGHTSYYVVTFKNGGFVVVSGQKTNGPVLMYSPSSIYDPNDLPPAFSALMDCYEFNIDYAYKNNKLNKNKLEKWDKLEKGKEEVNLKSGNTSGTWPDFLLTTMWGQMRTNNADCPGYNSHPNIPDNSCGWRFCDHCAAGCVAVAQGQIMNYWSYAQGDSADFDWWDMPYPGLISTDTDFNLEQQAVSYFLKRIGDEVGMKYCKDGCSSQSVLWLPTGWSPDAKEAFITFGYDDNEINFELKTLHTYNSWVSHLSEEINAGRPVMYGVKGHALVLDGYRPDNDNFHFNLGWTNVHVWSDFEDLYIDSLHDYTQTFYHCAVIGILPNAQTNKTFTNLTYQSGTNKTFQVRDNIVSENVIINNGAHLRYVAGNNIHLGAGFRVELGGEFLGRTFGGTMFKSAEINSDVYLISSKTNIIKKEKSTNENTVTIYPNPSDGKITVYIAGFKNPINYCVFNIFGSNILSGVLSQNLSSIYLDNQNKGVYFVKLFFDNQIVIKKIELL